jgi:hypothetical protein
MIMLIGGRCVEEHVDVALLVPKQGQAAIDMDVQ